MSAVTGTGVVGSEFHFATTLPDVDVDNAEGAGSDLSRPDRTAILPGQARARIDRSSRLVCP